jgi:hypothetical protein
MVCDAMGALCRRPCLLDAFHRSRFRNSSNGAAQVAFRTGLRRLVKVAAQVHHGV